MAASAPQLAFNRQHLRPGDRVCVAVSGGADSVALLRALHAANGAPREALGVGLSAVHVQHHLRGAEAEIDLEFVQDLCQTLAVPLHVEHVDVREQVARTGETTEEAARSLRYGVFHRLIASGEADVVVTGHTLEDQAETVLMKLLRGAWTAGLGGIFPCLDVPSTANGPGRKGWIVRPLLETHRSEVEAYLGELGQSWREDSSNTDPAFTRNRLRHTILPLLREENPGLDQTLGQLAAVARDEEAHWQAEMARLLPQLLLPGRPVRGGGRAVGTSPGEAAVAIELDRLRNHHPALRRRVLRAAALQIGGRLSFAETERLLALCGFATAPGVAARNGASLTLAGNLRAERSVREIRLLRRDPPALTGEA